MQIEANVLTYTRRDVLRASGVIAAAAATLQILPVAQMKGVAQLAPLELGVVLPRSAAYVHLSESILAGLRLYFAQHSGRSIALRTRELAPGSGAIGAAAEQLQASGPLDFLIGMVTPAVAAQLHERLVSSGTVFVNATVGANVPREIDRSAHVLHSSLAHWEASWALGRWAAQHLGRRGIVATSLYDSGYDALYAFRRGFEGGGARSSRRTSPISPGAVRTIRRSRRSSGRTQISSTPPIADKRRSTSYAPTRVPGWRRASR